MTTASPPTNLQRLETIEKRCEEQAQRIAELERIVRAIGAVFGGSAAAASSGVATDRELDCQYGDAQVKIIPRDWTAGGVVKGQKMSLCPPDFLDVFAETMDFFAERNDANGEKDAKGRPKSHWDRQNAKLARGWARRIRGGWQPPAQPKGFGHQSAEPGANPFAGAPVDWRSSRVITPPKAAPPPPPSAPSAEDDDTSFDFGANVVPNPAAAAVLLDDDEDDLPLGESAPASADPGGDDGFDFGFNKGPAKADDDVGF